MMKVMRLVIGRSGFSIAKIAILIGGPGVSFQVLFHLAFVCIACAQNKPDYTSCLTYASRHAPPTIALIG